MQHPLSLMSFNDDILADILKHLGRVYVIGHDYSLRDETAGSLRIAACVNRRLRRIVHTTAAKTCVLKDGSALDICSSCPQMASILFRNTDGVRFGPYAARALAKHQSFAGVASNSFKCLKEVHVTGAELSTGLVQALACSECVLNPGTHKSAYCGPAVSAHDLAEITR